MPNRQRQKQKKWMQARPLEDDEFRTLPGFSAYLVSRNGYVIGRFGQRIRGCVNPDGYIRLKLTDDTGRKQERKEHRMVALAFLGDPPSSDHVVAHNDGNPRNSAVENLRWATQKENQADCYKHGTMRYGSRNGRWRGGRNAEQTG